MGQALDSLHDDLDLKRSSVGQCLTYIFSWTHRGSTRLFFLLLLSVGSPFLCFIEVFNVYLCFYIGLVRKPPREKNIFLCLTTAVLLTKIWPLKYICPTPLALAAVRSKAVVLLLLIHSSLLLPLFVGVLCLVLVLMCNI